MIVGKVYVEGMGEVIEIRDGIDRYIYVTKDTVHSFKCKWQDLTKEEDIIWEAITRKELEYNMFKSSIEAIRIVLEMNRYKCAIIS